ASAIVGSDGQMSGLAIYHRIPANPEFEQFLKQHEGAELWHMNNLVTAGMDPGEAYHEAHDKIATPIETAAVRAHAARTGQDPDEYLDRYKQFWRDAASIASEPSDRDRHPYAHTTLFGLDEHELGRSFSTKDLPHVASMAGITSESANLDQLEKALDMHDKGASKDDIFKTTGWYRDGVDGHWKYEIPDNDVKINKGLLKDSSMKQWTTGNPMYKLPGDKEFKLKELLDHPELYKAYPELGETPVRALNPMKSLNGTKAGVDLEGRIHLGT